MPNRGLLARIRRKQTSNAPATQEQLQQSIAAPVLIPSPPLERKIHPNLDALVADYSPDVTQTEPGPSSRGPVAPRSSLPVARRALIITSESTRSPIIPTPLADTSEAPGAAHPSGWSTFGRRNDAAAPSHSHLADFGQPSRPPSQRSDSYTHMHPDTPTSTSRSHFTTPRSNSQSNDQIQTPPQASAGHPVSPPSSGFTFGSRGYGRSTMNMSTAPEPPPLPPLDHPAFDKTEETGLSSGSRKTNTRHFRQSSSLPSLSSSRRRRIAVGGDRVRAQDIFPSPSTRVSKRRSQSVGPGGRRNSAEYSASQTRVGGSWEATVSRELVLMSLGFPEEDDERVGTGETRAGRNLKDGLGPEDRPGNLKEAEEARVGNVSSHHSFCMDPCSLLSHSLSFLFW